MVSTAKFVIPLRAAQAVLAIIALGLVAYFLNHAIDNNNPANFMVFNSIWTFLALAYLVAAPLFVPGLHNHWAVLGFEAITMLFWFAGFIAFAVSLRDWSCIVNGRNKCGSLDAARAGVAFGAFSWLAWSVTLGLVIHALVQNRDSSAEGAVGGIEGGVGGAQMQQQPQPQQGQEYQYDSQGSELGQQQQQRVGGY